MERRYTLITSGQVSVKDFTPLLLLTDAWADSPRGSIELVDAGWDGTSC